MLRSILVPLDGSPLAEKALDMAHRVLAPDGKATLLTVIQKPSPPIYAYPAADILDQIVEDHSHTETAAQQARDYMERMAKNFKLSGMQNVTVEIGHGDPAEAILEYAHKLGVEAIIMSTHGRSGISRILFGSVTLKVLNDTPCPVIVVPNREQQRTEQPQASEALDLGKNRLARQ
jgi:nucleotide-binding universal stress UspA family protein